MCREAIGRDWKGVRRFWKGSQEGVSEREEMEASQHGYRTIDKELKMEQGWWRKREK